jgi:hypothetical protein
MREHRLTSAKLSLSLFCAALLAFCGLQLATAQEHHHGAEKTFVGHVVDVSCYVSHGSIGEAHRECAETCAKAGIPLAILDQQTGTLYLPLAKSHHEPANKGLMAFVEKDVRVTGTVTEKDGLKTIAIESIAAAN